MDNGALIRATYSRSHRAKSRCPSGQELCRGVSRLRSTRTEREVERLGSEVQIPSPTLFDATSARLPSLGPSTCFGAIGVSAAPGATEVSSRMRARKAASALPSSSARVTKVTDDGLTARPLRDRKSAV